MLEVLLRRHRDRAPGRLRGGSRPSLIAGQSGVSLIEVMVSTIVLTIVAVGLIVYFARGRVWFDHEEHKRVATQLAQDSMERAMAQDYLSLFAWEETRKIAGITYTIEVEVTDDAPASGMKTIESTVWWNQTSQAKRSVSLVTMRYGSSS